MFSSRLCLNWTLDRKVRKNMVDLLANQICCTTPAVRLYVCMILLLWQVQFTLAILPLAVCIGIWTFYHGVNDVKILESICSERALIVTERRGRHQTSACHVHVGMCMWWSFLWVAQNLRWIAASTFGAHPPFPTVQPQQYQYISSGPNILEPRTRF